MTLRRFHNMNGLLIKRTARVISDYCRFLSPHAVMKLFVVCLTFCLIIVPVTIGCAADVSLDLNLSSSDNIVSVSLHNRAGADAHIKEIDISLDGKKYALLNSAAVISPGAALQPTVTVQLPAIPGSYPLIATVRYYNDNQLLTMRHVGLFYYRQQAPMPQSCQLEDVSLTDSGKIVVRAATPDIWKVVLPEEIAVVSVKSSPGRKTFTVRSTIDGLDNSYTYFAVAEDESGGLHRTAVARGTLKLQSTATFRAAHGRITTPMLCGFFMLCTAALLFSRAASRQKGLCSLSLHKYASRMLLITTAYLLLKNGGAGAAFVLEYVEVPILREFCTIVVNHFNGSNYLHFFTYFIDAYFLTCLLLLYPFLYYYESGIPLHEDKYSSLLLTVASIGSVVRGGTFYWNYTSRLGLLTCCVKLFFLPLLVSWVINNTFHQINISKTFVFDLVALNAWLLSLFIYVDTILFCFGYIFEFKFLKNEIRSVEPTFLGWLVCLWCYPPFNSVSYRIFDHRLIDIGHAWPANVVMTMTFLITALWGIFAWASVALGTKASNLTNRGIVSSGPYRYVRHPAYASKLLVFYIQGIFLGQYFLGLLFGFTIIYALRAWTEERHLSLDPDYLEYKNLVKWRFIPGVM